MAAMASLAAPLAARAVHPARPHAQSQDAALAQCSAFQIRSIEPQSRHRVASSRHLTTTSTAGVRRAPAPLPGPIWQHPQQYKLPVTSCAAASEASQAAAAASEAAPGFARGLVDELLVLIEGTDRGASADEGVRQRVQALAEELEALGMPQPLQSPLIFGDWEVGYTSRPTAAGGYYRSLLGRSLLRTEDMVQSIYAPNGVGNLVSFQAFSALPGRVSLKGVFKALDDKWVEVTFESPELALGPLAFTYGGESKVRLATTYLDERVRLGRGSQGSLFVFVRK